MFQKIMLTGIIYLMLYSLICTALTRVPSGFEFGAATAAYQIEGGYNSDGKGESIWDKYTHTQPSPIKDNSTGDIACDSYNLWDEDINIMKFLNIYFYRFSISWTRILPTGFSNQINLEGIGYYDNLINALLEIGVEPMITLYHWDLPQRIQDLGGWTNAITINYFVEFAEIMFRRFGDRVKTWITINEPSSICVDVYENGNGAPGFISPGLGSYLCGKHILLAHAKVYKLYVEKFKDEQFGKVGITIDSIWAEPEDQDDQEAAEREMQMSFGWFAHPIFSKTGDYPEVMKSRIAQRSSIQNFTTSRLPSFTPEEVALLKNSADFLGLNHYHTLAALDAEYSASEVSFLADKGTELRTGNWNDMDIVPWGFRKLLNWIKNEYDNPLVYVTENGFGDTNEVQDDKRRVQYLQAYISAMFTAIRDDGCNVTKYTVWSLMDNMEWTDGYTIKYGLYHVNFSDPHRTRTARTSAFFYKGMCSLSSEVNLLVV